MATGIIIIIKNEKIRVTLCENAAGALYIVNNCIVELVQNLKNASKGISTKPYTQGAK